MAVSKRLRYEILRRDNHACRYCGATAPSVKLTIDHVTPEALGGTDTPDNLVTACADCNNGKTSTAPDAELVTDVEQDAFRWAAAMKQAAENTRDQEKPKLEYRAAFKGEWDRWGIGEGKDRRKLNLPADWKGSIERFRIAGLPAWAWEDIVDTAMGNKKVQPDNKFKYCCGIAWNRVAAIQREARAIIGVDRAPAPADSVVQAAIDVWTSEQNGPVDSSELAQFRASATAARTFHDAHRVVQAAQWAAWFGLTDVEAALAALDRDEALQKWSLAWFTRSGDWPDSDQTERVSQQIDQLLQAEVAVARVERAAIYAGTRRSTRLFLGLSAEELEATGEHEVLARAVGTWAESFQASASRWPTSDEVRAFFDSLRKIGADGDIWLSDLYQAAAAAGQYQDPDMSTALTRHTSVFEAAARPLSGGAA